MVLGSQPHASAATIPPAAVKDFSISATVGGTSALLSWTAPGNEGITGTAVSYDIRYSNTLITETTWATATQVSGEPTPSVAGTQQSMTITGLTANTRFYFAIKTANSTLVSGISNPAANLISNINQVDVMAYNFPSYDSRNRRLMEMIQPDFIHRAMFEWVGTIFQDNNFLGVRQGLDKLKARGITTAGAVSSNYWTPFVETIAPGVNVTEANGSYVLWDQVYHINKSTASGKAQLKYKAKKQVDNGVDGIEYDEYVADSGTIAEVMNEVRNYAQNTYGKKIYMSTNAVYGGQDFTMNGSSNNGTEAVDYYIRNYPYRLGDGGLPSPGSFADFDGTYNLMPNLRAAHQNVAPKPFFYFIDFSAPLNYWTPHVTSQQANFMRIGNAQILASGGFPAQFRSFYNTIDTFDQGLFTIQANLAKFMRENSVLLHNLTWITPTTLSSTAANVRTSALGQTGRTLLHLVNGNYNNTTQTMASISNFSVNISLNTAPTNIWMTTTDKPANTRKQTLSYTFANGIATINVPDLAFHNVIVIEQGTSYNPVYSPMEVKFPFPLRSSLPVNNAYQIIALQTEGKDSLFNWYVNDILGGNSTYGTITDTGIYKAPGTVPSGGKVTIKAVSKEVITVNNQFQIDITGNKTLPFTENFSLDASGAIPAQWEIVDGKGDWVTALDGTTKVLHNSNLAEGSLEDGTASYTPTIVGGDQTWTNYRLMFSVKPIKTPYVWYNLDRFKPDTFIGVVFRYKDSSNYYQYRLSYDNKIRLFNTVNGVTTEIGLPLVALFPAINAYAKIEIQVNGTEYQFYINGSLVRTDYDSSNMLGGIGFIANLTENYFKDITVSEPVDIIIDTMNDYSKIFSRSVNLFFDSVNSSLLGGDTSRLTRTTSTNEWVIYQAAFGMRSFSTDTWFWPSEATVDFKFYTSPDNSTYTEFTPVKTTVNGTGGNWNKVIYSGNMSVGTKYLKIEFRNTSANNWNPQMGSVQIISNATPPPVTITDQMNDYTKIFSRSANLVFDSVNASLLGGDTSRLTRTTSTNEWIIYQSALGIRSFSADIWFWPSEATVDFKFYTSPDNMTYTEFTPVKTTLTGTNLNWNKVIYSGNVSVGTKYLKIEFRNTSVNNWNPQIGSVQIISNTTISPVTITDPMNDYTKIFSRSANLVFDSVNASLLGGDTSRLTRTTSTNEWTIYQEISGIYFFSTDTWFWPSEATVDFKFYTSPDNTTYTEFTPVKTTVNGTNPNWNKVAYSGNVLAGTKYLKIEFRNTSTNNWNPQIGSVRIN